MMDGVRLGGVFRAQLFDKDDGHLKWETEEHNLVPNAGLQHMLDVVFSGGTAVDPWYVGLIGDTTTVAAADTLASHAGWTENTNYSGNRKEYVEVRSSQQLSNSASTADFTLTADSQTIGGAFLCSAASGTSGTLIAEAAFSGGDKSGDSGDILQITYTFSAADDGA